MSALESQAEFAVLRAALATTRSRLDSAPQAAADEALALFERAEQLRVADCIAQAALLAADALFRNNQVVPAERCIARALAALAKSGNGGPMGRLYKLHAMLLLSADRIALALAAARQALKCEDLSPAERPYAYGTIAVCFIELYQFDLGRKVMIEHMLPAAAVSGSPSALFACNGRMAGLMQIYACLAGGIPHWCTIGASPKLKLEPQAVYLRRANEHLDACSNLTGRVGDFEQAWHFTMRGLVTNLELGFDAAEPWFERARSAVDHRSVRGQMMVLANRGVALRIAKRYDAALDALRQALAMADASGDDAERRMIAYDLAIVYRELGRTVEAIEAMELHMRLHAQRSTIATSWSHDEATLHHYGNEPELQAVRAAMRRTVEPASLKRADAYIERNLERRVTVADVARDVGVSTRKLQSLYRRYRDETVSAVIREQKMLHARTLLSREQLTVTHIADRLGYTSTANFSRDFRQRFGITPTAARAESARPLESFSAAD